MMENNMTTPDVDFSCRECGYEYDIMERAKFCKNCGKRQEYEYD